MTETKIKERLEALKRDLQILQQRIFAVEGAILDCEYWLSEVSKEKTEVNGS